MRQQKICFVRHGIAKHNLPDPLTGGPPNIKSMAMFDPPLVYDGKKLAMQAGEKIKMWWRTTQLGEEIELIVTSPLTHCMQTAICGFLPGDCYTSNGRQEPKFFCTEYVREAFGMHYLIDEGSHGTYYVKEETKKSKPRCFLMLCNV